MRALEIGDSFIYEEEGQEETLLVGEILEIYELNARSDVE